MLIVKKIFQSAFVLAGWKVEGKLPPHPRRFVIIGGPHSTDWDVIFGLGACELIGLKTRFLVTHKVFSGYKGWVLRSFGAIPVNKDANQGTVNTAVKMFKENEAFTMIIALEGTKYKTNSFRTGFYHIATQAKVPILMANLDYKRKVIGLSELYYPTGNMETDFQYVWDYYCAHNFPAVQGRGISGTLEFNSAKLESAEKI